MAQIDGTGFAAKFMSEPIPPLAEETRQAAATYVRSHATDATETHMLLSMLGLLEENDDAA